MKTVKFKIVHRLVLKNMLDAKGNEGATLSDLNKMLKVVDKLVLSEEEVKRVDLRVEDGALKWQTVGPEQEDLDPAKEIEFSDDQVDVLKAMLKEKNDKKEFKLSEAAPLNDIATELGLEL